MSEKLESSALILTIISFIITLWYNDIALALTTADKNNANRDYGFIQKILFTRLLPLSIVTLSFWLIYLPDAINLVCDTRELLKTKQYIYDSASTAFFFVNILSFVFLIIISITFFILLYRFCTLPKPIINVQE